MNVTDREHPNADVHRLPRQRGTYVLVLSVCQSRPMTVGRLGKFLVRPGSYAYVGSAFGMGGLRARVLHHLESVRAPHWHIDYLMAFATPVEVWYAVSDRKLERDWVELFEGEPRFSCPIPRFGSSDYHRTRTSHLFFTKGRLSFRWFEQRVRDLFEPHVQPGCVSIPNRCGEAAPCFPR